MSPIGDFLDQLKQPNDRREDGRRVASESLPLDARVERVGAGWIVRLPLRAEQVHVEKQAVVAEQVVVRKRSVEDHVRVDDTVRREELRVDGDRAASDDATVPISRPRRGFRQPYKI